MVRFLFAALIIAASLTSAFGQTPLQNCAAQLIGGSVANAPTIGGSPPDKPFATDRQLCYRIPDQSFFVSEYWPDQFAPRWAAYRLDPEHYGPKGCRTYTRGKGNCYVTAKSWTDFQNCTKAPDPFHPDNMLQGEKLAPGDFSNTAHDQGHMAPRQAFSWHVCGAYQTFTMANMSFPHVIDTSGRFAVLGRSIENSL